MRPANLCEAQSWLNVSGRLPRNLDRTRRCRAGLDRVSPTTAAGVGIARHVQALLSLKLFHVACSSHGHLQCQGGPGALADGFGQKTDMFRNGLPNRRGSVKFDSCWRNGRAGSMYNHHCRRARFCVPADYVPCWQVQPILLTLLPGGANNYVH
jgi:hypothetical protein